MRETVVAGQFVNQTSFLAAPADAGSGGTIKEKPIVLVVEDDFLVATDLEHALREAGYEVAGVAVSATEAIALAKKSRVTVAVMDVRLVGERETASTAACIAAVGSNLVALTAVATADRGDVINYVLIVSHIYAHFRAEIVPRILTDQGRIRLASVKIRGPFSA